MDASDGQDLDGRGGVGEPAGVINEVSSKPSQPSDALALRVRFGAAGHQCLQSAGRAASVERVHAQALQGRRLE